MEKNPPGRRAGVPNKLTAAARHVVFEVFDQIGGAQNMAEWAKENRTEFYKLWGKTIPQNIKSDVDGNITIQIVNMSNANTTTS